VAKWERSANYGAAERAYDDEIFARYLSGELTTPPAWVKRDVDGAAEVLSTLRFY
jgi:hypothetical protein